MVINTCLLVIAESNKASFVTLNRSSKAYFVLKIHLQPAAFMEGVRGTSSHASFSKKALNSSTMHGITPDGTLHTLEKVVGSVSTCLTLRDKTFSSLTILDLAGVCMGCYFWSSCRGAAVKDSYSGLDWGRQGWDGDRLVSEREEWSWRFEDQWRI